MGNRAVARRLHIDPRHWSISFKVVAGPLVIVVLLCLVVLYGWSVADQHHRLANETYDRHVVFEETALRLPLLLSDIQRELYKLASWGQIGVAGSEITSTEGGIRSKLADVENIIELFAKHQSVGPLKETLRRYRQSVEQTLILVERNARMAATATRGIDHIYHEAKWTSERLVATSEAEYDRRMKELQDLWRRSIIRFALMLGAVVLTVPLLALAASRMIATPMRNLAFVVDRFRGGEFDVQIPWRTRRDEIGLVAQAMESFKANLVRNQVLEREREQSNLELERKVELRTHELAEQKERLAKALEREHEVNGLQRQFVSMVCHEFRTPLAIIDGSAQRILKRHDRMTRERLTDVLGKVRTSVTRLTELMESVLSASKLEAGAIEIAAVPCDLAEMITEVTSNYRELNPGYRISTDIEGLPERFTADPRLLRQVISNLVSNAVKYSPGGSEIRVEGRSCAEGGVAIAVQDQGVGIPEEELEKLFQRFFRASTSTGIAGTGIGLHMVKALVDMHGGRIEVASEEGTGTTFTVHLPRRDPPRCEPDETSKAA